MHEAVGAPPSITLPQTHHRTPQRDKPDGFRSLSWLEGMHWPLLHACSVCVCVCRPRAARPGQAPTSTGRPEGRESPLHKMLITASPGSAAAVPSHRSRLSRAAGPANPVPKGQPPRPCYLAPRHQGARSCSRQRPQGAPSSAPPVGSWRKNTCCSSHISSPRGPPAQPAAAPLACWPPASYTLRQS